MSGVSDVRTALLALSLTILLQIALEGSRAAPDLSLDPIEMVPRRQSRGRAVAMSRLSYLQS